MGDANAASVLDGLLDPLSECLDAESARRVAEFELADDVQARVEKLAESANEGHLNEAARAEYEAVVNAADLIAILKLKALRQLESRRDA
jgi:hypothetical protein